MEEAARGCCRGRRSCSSRFDRRACVELPPGSCRAHYGVTLRAATACIGQQMLQTSRPNRCLISHFNMQAFDTLLKLFTQEAVDEGRKNFHCGDGATKRGSNQLLLFNPFVKKKQSC